MKRLFAIALLLAGATARAQSDVPQVTTHIQPDSVMIGDRFDLMVDVEKDLVQVVQFPEFEDKPGSAIELHKEHPVDTLERDGRHLKLRKRYTLAAFEEGKWNLGRPAVLYADKNIVDTLWARDSLYLEVATFQIDSTSQSIYDVKPQWNLPFRFGEVSGYAQWGALALVLLLAAAYALKRYLESRGKRLGDLFRPSPPQPPHVVAIKALEALHHQKLWQNNKHKQYYSALTDILRTYVAARWGFGAMEMTSDEIIETMRAEELPDKARMDLTAILRDADLVKFAKATPEAEQNEADYLKAYYFVEETKVAEAEEETEEQEPAKTKMRDRCINSYTQRYSSWPRSGLRHRTCPNAARCGAATGNTTRATTRRASNVTSGRWRPHRSRSRRLTTSATHSTRPNGSTRPSRPCAKLRPTRCVRTGSVPKRSTTSATPSSSSRNTRRRSKATNSRCG